jgi:hypothetical protein
MPIPLRCLARGLPNQEIVYELSVIVEAVKSHVATVLMKLGVRNRTQAVIEAYESEFVAPGEGDGGATLLSWGSAESTRPGEGDSRPWGARGRRRRRTMDA